jgi:hypothetical protein
VILDHSDCRSRGGSKCHRAHFRNRDRRTDLDQPRRWKRLAHAIAHCFTASLDHEQLELYVARVFEQRRQAAFEIAIAIDGRNDDR